MNIVVSLTGCLKTSIKCIKLNGTLHANMITSLKMIEFLCKSVQDASCLILLMVLHACFFFRAIKLCFFFACWVCNTAVWCVLCISKNQRHQSKLIYLMPFQSLSAVRGDRGEITLCLIINTAYSTCASVCYSPPVSFVLTRFSLFVCFLLVNSGVVLWKKLGFGRLFFECATVHAFCSVLPWSSFPPLHTK